MGCTPSNIKRSILKRQSTKSIPSQIPTLSRYSTLNSQDFRSKQPSPKTLSCLHLAFQPINPKCAQKTINLTKTQLSQQSVPHLSTYNKIRLLYSVLSSDFSDFCNIIHSSCIPKFSFKKGLKILLLALQSNKEVQIEFLDEAPYVQVSGNLNEETLVVMQKWKSLAFTIKAVMENETDEFLKHVRELSKFQDTVEEYSGFVLKPIKLVKAAKYLKSAVETADSVFTQAYELHKQAQKCLTRSCLKSRGKKLMKLKNATRINGEVIVHTLY